LGRRSDAIQAIEVRSVRISGKPSAVHSAELIIHFTDGSNEHKYISFEPDGIMFEVFIEVINALNKNGKIKY
jgi:hypothetical protein